MRSFIEHEWLQSIWRDAKRWRHIPLGPISFTFKLGRRRLDRSVRSSQQGDNPQRAATHLPAVGNPAGLSASGAQDSAELCMKGSKCGPAVVIGVGPGLGEALATLLSQNGFQIALVSRSRPALEGFARQLRQLGGLVEVFPCDVTDERAVMGLMRKIHMMFGAPELVIYAVQAFCPGSLLTTDASAFEESWRANCFGAFLVAREAARSMQPVGRGTIIFAGATSGTIGRKGYMNLAVGKFGLRAISQVIAQELGPQGIHVAHVVIDGDISEGTQSSGEVQIKAGELAQLFLDLHVQPRSCWTSELDVRPAGEVFWKHC